jgi:calcineurin-like phosphoesterase family protein
MGSKVWVTADPHFSHTNIIKYENRPFKDSNHMDESLIKYWNQIVSKQDKVFLLGDVGLGKPETLKSKIERLHGNITLVLGNHDHKSVERWMEAGIKEVSKYPILYRGFYLLSHEPISMNEYTPFVNIYGHVHGHKSYETWSPAGVCVSVERHFYAPVDFNDIEAYFRKVKNG